MPQRGVAFTFKESSGCFIAMAHRTLQRNAHCRVSSFDQLAGTRFRQAEQQHANAATTVRRMDTHECVEAHIFAAPHTAIANKVSVSCDDDPGIGVQVEAWSLPVDEYVLLCTVWHAIVCEVRRHTQFSKGLQVIHIW